MQVSRSHENESLGLGLASDQMRILVIEDDRDAAVWLIKGLTESGHVTDHAANGEDGLAMRFKAFMTFDCRPDAAQLDCLSLIRTLGHG